MFKWIRDPLAESNLKELDVKFAVESVPWKDINLELGLKHQTRLGKVIDENYVQQLAERMEQGHDFKMSILQKTPGHRPSYFPWSGNHRLGGYKFYTFCHNITPTTIEAYVVQLYDGRMMDLLPVVANIWEGRGLSKQERVLRCKAFMEKHGLNAQEAAPHFGIKPQWIYDQNSKDNARQVIANVPGAKLISPSTLKRLNVIAQKNAKVAKSVALLLVEHNVRGQEAYAVIEDVDAKEDELSMLAELKRWEDVFKQRSTPAPVPTPAANGPAGGRNAARRAAREGQVESIPSNVFSFATRDLFIRNLTALRKVLSNITSSEDALTKLQLADDPVRQVQVERDWEVVRGKMQFLYPAHQKGGVS